MKEEVMNEIMDALVSRCGSDDNVWTLCQALRISLTAPGIRGDNYGISTYWVTRLLAGLVPAHAEEIVDTDAITLLEAFCARF